MTDDNIRSPRNQGPPICPDCQGRGWRDNLCPKSDEAMTCSLCSGKGRDSVGRTCTGCGGTGRIEVRLADKSACTLCRGAGVYPVPESMPIAEFAFRPWEGRKNSR